jgi:thiamine-monophosphate kinase
MARKKLVSDVGEVPLVELARKICKSGPRVKLGPGDDAAVVETDGIYLVVTTDMLVSRTHFPPGTEAEQIGHKAVVSNLSDLAAMGADPLGLVFSIAFPRSTEIDFVKRLLKGLDKTSREYGAYVVGGDLDESDDVIIAGTAFGIAPNGKYITRSGAKPGDLVAVTGSLGAAAAGLKILLDGLKARGFKQLIKAQLEPKARVREGKLIAQSGRATSMIDITDGFAASLWLIARESGVKIVVDEDKLPIDDLTKRFAHKYGLSAKDLALFGGDDLELIFTIKREGWEKVESEIRGIGSDITLIGEVKEGKGVYIRRGEEIEKLPDRGYRHFQ